MSDFKMCQGCGVAKHPKIQWCCDKCEAMYQLSEAMALANAAYQAINEKWVNK